jgi:hypothetical protein
MSSSALYAAVISPWGNTNVPDILSEFPVVGFVLASLRT